MGVEDVVEVESRCAKLTTLRNLSQLCASQWVGFCRLERDQIHTRYFVPTCT